MIRTFQSRIKSTIGLAEHLIQRLKQYTVDPHKALGQFTRGGFIFAFGLMITILADALIEPGLGQELLALFGLMLTVIGGLFALWGYLNISLLKLLIFIFDRNSRE